MTIITFEDATRDRLVAEQAARAAVRPYVGELPALPAVSSERVFRQACIRLHVDISDLTLDNLDVDTAFRDRFNEWAASKNATANDQQDRDAVRAIQAYERAYADFEDLMGEPYPVDDTEIPTAAEIHRCALGRMNLEVPDDDAACAAVFNALLQEGLRTSAKMAGDSARITDATVNAFHSRFPSIPRQRWA